MHTLKKVNFPPRNVEICDAVARQEYSRDILQSADVQVNHTVKQSHFSHSPESTKMTKFLPSGDFGAIVAKFNKQKPAALLTEQYDLYSRTQGASGALSMPSVFDNAVKGDGSKSMLVEHKQPKTDFVSAKESG